MNVDKDNDTMAIAAVKTVIECQIKINVYGCNLVHLFLIESF